jgi:hypothetical protein
MARRLTTWLTNDGTTDVAVATSSKTAAARAMKRSLYSFNQFASDLQDDHEIAVMCCARPGVVFTRSNRTANAEWRALDE